MEAKSGLKSTRIYAVLGLISLIIILFCSTYNWSRSCSMDFSRYVITYSDNTKEITVKVTNENFLKGNWPTVSGVIYNSDDNPCYYYKNDSIKSEIVWIHTYNGPEKTKLNSLGKLGIYHLVECSKYSFFKRIKNETSYFWFKLWH